MSEAESTHRPRVTLWRTLTWPIGPTLLVGRFSVQPRAAEILCEAGLPGPVKTLIADVIHRTRLWHSEQADVARELIAHFEDALRSSDVDAAIHGFGHPAQAARLIRRAKRRGRGMRWHAWIRAWQAVALLLVLLVLMYLALLIRYVAASPAITRDFAAELSAPALAVPEERRAWPLYREAYIALGPLPEGLRRQSEPGRYAHPGDAAWAEVPAFLDEHRDVLELTRRAAARPSLGYILFDTPDPEVFARGQILAGQDRDRVLARARDYAAEDRPLFMKLYDLHALRTLGHLLIADARHAAEVGDAERAAADIRALIGIAAHFGEVPIFLGSTSASNILIGAAGALGNMLHLHPQLFSDDQLRDLVHVFGSAETTWLFTSLRGERAAIEDVVQRSYTDDGAGGGRLTPDGVEMLSMLMGMSPATPESLESALDRRALHPVIGALVADRAELSQEVERTFARLQSELAIPPWEWEDRPGEGIHLDPEHDRWRQRYPMLAIMLPAVGTFAERAVHAALIRDAATVAIALELHRRREGSYPRSLEELTPHLLPRVPTDPFDGQPIRYRLDDAGPIVYAVGANRIDNGGIGPPADAVLRDARRYRRLHGLRSLAHIERLVALDGDWILWPPAE